MIYFAKINDSGVVTEVVVIEQDQENRGQEFLAEDLGLGGRWEKTCYNTHGGVYHDPETNEPSIDQSKAYRKNFAGPGYSYDEERDAFIPPRPFESWTLNEDTCLWEAPISKPETGGPWIWNEENQEWEEFIFPED